MANADWDEIRKTYEAWQAAENTFQAEWHRIVATMANVDADALGALDKARSRAYEAFREAARPIEH